MRKKSWKQRIVSIFLTLVMLLTSLLTGKGVIVKAAPLRLNEVTRGTDITSLPGSSFDLATDQLDFVCTMSVELCFHGSKMKILCQK